MAARVRVLAQESNLRGDLFAALCENFLFALGYSPIRRNVQKAGREVDIMALHRVEPRRAIAECKAKATPVGGDELNKFAGVLGVERATSPNGETVGYFISLSGFKGTATQQEEDAGHRFALVDSDGLVAELIRGRMLVPEERAAATAGACASSQPHLTLAESGVVLHELGLVWVFYFRAESTTSHYALVHADGYALDTTLAERIQRADAEVGGDLHGLIYLAPPILAPATSADPPKWYLDYIVREYGSITLEGLPQDQEVGGRSLSLEEIYVPLRLRRPRTPGTDEAAGEDLGAAGERTADIDPEVEDADETITIEDAFRSSPRVAIVAPPGSGKTTLLKRLAIACAHRVDSGPAEDGLPEGTWLPLVIRCRQLGTLVRQPITEALQNIPGRAELPHLADEFNSFVRAHLRAGDVLLLVDGLDEITDPSDRAAFVEQLRTFLATYPAVRAVITSREHGYRAVAGSIAAACDLYRLAEFSDEDIIRLTVAWHVHVVSDSDEVRRDAESLASAIIETPRVRTLARNPLLLTTLLLVKRWVGELPRKRSILYGKAIEVLLATWNVEAHEPIDQEEAVPQLAFVAFQMMVSREQQLSLRTLEDYLHEARRQMPDLLGYARASIPDLIKRVEERSSLLMLSGHTIEDGELRPLYEFKHLTFQEYLAALAAVRGFHPGRSPTDTLVSVLDAHILDRGWREVISLAAVLAGREGGPLVQLLVDQRVAILRDLSVEEVLLSENYVLAANDPAAENAEYLAELLFDAVVDEVPMTPEMVTSACGAALRAPRSRPVGSEYAHVLVSRYGDAFRQTVRELAERATPLVDPDAVAALADLYVYDHGGPKQMRLDNRESFERICAALGGDDPFERSGAAAAVGLLVYNHQAVAPDTRKNVPRLVTLLLDVLGDDARHCKLASSWAIAWLADRDYFSRKQTSRILQELVTQWMQTDDPLLRRWIAWALSELPLLPRETVAMQTVGDLAAFLQHEADAEMLGWSHDRLVAAIVVAYYCRVWSDAAIINRIRSALSGPDSHFVREKPVAAIIHALGAVDVLDELDDAMRARSPRRAKTAKQRRQ